MTVAIFFQFAASYQYMGLVTKSIVAVIHFVEGVNKMRNSMLLNYFWNVGTWLYNYHGLSSCFWGFLTHGTYYDQATQGSFLPALHSLLWASMNSF